MFSDKGLINNTVNILFGFDLINCYWHIKIAIFKWRKKLVNTHSSICFFMGKLYINKCGPRKDMKDIIMRLYIFNYPS